MNRLLRRVIHSVIVNSSEKLPKPITSQSVKWFSETQGNKIVTEDEIKNLLEKRFPNSQRINVEDVSGGCGAMFNILVESNEFKGLSIVKQHRIVYSALEKQIKTIHGLQLETKVPS